MKGGGGSDKNNKDINKSWENKAKDNADDSKKELAALVKKATQLIEKNELNAIDLEKKVKHARSAMSIGTAKKKSKSRSSALLMSS
mgnify:CR=1 FL=1